MRTNTVERGFSFYKAARWIVLIALVFVIIAALRKPAPPGSAPDATMVAENARKFESKLSEMQQARQRGESGSEARFSPEEVNSFIAEASQRAASASSPASSTPVQPSAPSASSDEMPVKSTQVNFQGDEVIAQALTERYGQDIYITLRGKLGASNGYLTFAPTEFQIGRMSVPVLLIDSSLQKKLAEPETRAKLKLPDFVSDLRVENGQLVIRQK